MYFPVVFYSDPSVFVHWQDIANLATVRAYLEAFDFAISVLFDRKSFSRVDFNASNQVFPVVTFLIRRRVQTLGVYETHDFSKTHASMTDVSDHVADTKGFLFPVLEFIYPSALIFAKLEKFQLFVVMPV